MASTGPPMTNEQQLREMNEALLVSSVHQHELTEQARKAEEVSARLAAIVESSDDAIISKDLHGVIISWNKGAEHLFGYVAEEVVGKPVALLIPPDRINEEPEILARLSRGEAIDHYETVRRRKDGSLVEVSLTVSPIRDSAGRVIGAAKIARDITERKQAGEALRESQQQLRRNAETFSNFVEHAPFGIYVVDAKFRISQVNDGAQAAFRNVKPLIGRDFGEAMHILWPEPFASQVIDIFRRTLETGEPYVAPSLTEQRRDTKTTESYEWQVHRVTLPDGQYGVVCYFFDATRLRQAEVALRDSEERFRHLADNIPQLAWIADAGTDGQVHWFNQNWYDYTGTTLEQMKGQGWHSVHHPDHAERVIQKFAHHVREGLDWEDTFPLRAKDGSFRWFLSRMKVIRDQSGAVGRIFGTNTDVTDQRQMADELRQNAADMSEADRRKNEFLAMLAHELRNPLAPIRNALQILQLTGADGKAVASASALMKRQVGQMVRLVDDLLDISRISRGKIELKRGRIELASSVHHAVEATRSLYESMGHELLVTLPPQPVYLNADPTRLAQIVGNLLNNACKFTDKGGRISLTVEVLFSREREASADAAALASGSRLNEVTIRVRDTGVGIAVDQLPRIFDMFVQVDTSLERSVSGLGIGLTLVKNLVEMHGGTVEGHSAGAGQGSEFIVRLPILRDAQARKHPDTETNAKEAPAVAALPRRILVVDDNRDSATSLAMLLKLSGHETHTAYDGLEAVNAAAKIRPDVVLLDIGLPKLNGYEAARRIREQPWGKKMALVALTGWGQDEDKHKSKNAGFNAHMVKPVDLDALAKLLGELPAVEK